MDGGRKEYQCHALSRLNRQIQSWEIGSTTLLDMIQINQDGDRTLSTVGSKASTIFFLQIEGIKVLFSAMENGRVWDVSAVSVGKQTNIVSDRLTDLPESNSETRDIFLLVVVHNVRLVSPWEWISFASYPGHLLAPNSRCSMCGPY